MRPRITRIHNIPGVGIPGVGVSQAKCLVTATSLLLLGAFSLTGVVGCGNDNGTDVSLVELNGVGTLPAGLSVSKVQTSNDSFQVLDFERSKGQQDVFDGTTDATGRYSVQIAPTRVAAVIITDVVRVSGLISADPNENGKTIAKDFNGVTDVACEAGATAISNGDIAADKFDNQRIANLEAAAQAIDSTVNHADPAAVTAAAAQVRTLTGDGDHPPA